VFSALKFVPLELKMSTTISENTDVIPCNASANFRRYMFATELKSDDKTEYVWNPEEASYFKKLPEFNEPGSYRHMLVIRRAIIGPSAKEGSTNLISVEMTCPDTETLTFPMVYLTQGDEPQSVVDLTFSDGPPSTLKFILSQGTGPVHLVGYHFVERVMVDDFDYGSSDEEEGLEEELSEDDNKMARDIVFNQRIREGIWNQKRKAMWSQGKRMTTTQNCNDSVAVGESDNEPVESFKEANGKN